MLTAIYLGILFLALYLDTKNAFKICKKQWIVIGGVILFVAGFILTSLHFFILGGIMVFVASLIFRRFSDISKLRLKSLVYSIFMLFFTVVFCGLIYKVMSTLEDVAAFILFTYFAGVQVTRVAQLFSEKMNKNKLKNK